MPGTGEKMLSREKGEENGSMVVEEKVSTTISIVHAFNRGVVRSLNA